MIQRRTVTIHGRFDITATHFSQSNHRRPPGFVAATTATATAAPPRLVPPSRTGPSRRSAAVSGAGAAGRRVGRHWTVSRTANIAGRPSKKRSLCVGCSGRRSGMGWDGMGWDGMRWDGMRWDGMGWDGIDGNGTGRDETGRDGTGRDGTERNGTGRGGDRAMVTGGCFTFPHDAQDYQQPAGPATGSRSERFVALSGPSRTPCAVRHPPDARHINF